VIEALGGKWNRGAQAHVFQEGVSVGAVLEEALLEGEVEKNPLGFFETPPAIVERLIDAAWVEAHHLVLEPSAGRGMIAGGLARRGVQAMTLVELDAQRCVTLRAGGFDVVQGDFLDPALELGRFDRVVMNPPFAKRVDLAHVRRAHGLLLPGGRLAAIMAAGVEFREERGSREFRDLVASTGGSIDRLPDNAFRAAGTSVRTVLVTLNAR